MKLAQKSPAAPDAGHPQERRAFLYVFLLAVVLTLVVELFNHKAFTSGADSFLEFVCGNPLAAVVNVALVLATLSPALFLRRRAFWCALISFIWVVGGAVNGFILLSRMTPFTVADLTVFNTGLDTLPNYLSTKYIVMLAVALVILVVGLILLFWKGPRNDYPLRHRLAAGLLAVVLCGGLLGGSWALAFRLGYLSNTFANLAFAYEDYGFSYCFLQTWLNKGIRRPENYNAESVQKLRQQAEDAAAAADADPQTDVNVIYVQLESFIDPKEITDLELSEDAVPTWTRLTEEYSSGYLTVPVVGAGTANTECEVLTGMSTKLFGPGEYPYQTRLMDRTVESVAYDLKENGCATHAIHNHRAAFYNRNDVYANLGFDDFTSIEYMPKAERTPKNWAKDSILVDQIIKALDVTEDQSDLVFTVSVQGHGKYPTEQVLEDPAITVKSCPDEEYHYAMEYYVNQIHEMDQFIQTLTDELSQRDEKTVLVLYGDHLPALNLEASDMKAGTLYRTRYVIWDNFGLEKQDENLTAYQLSAAVLGRLGITNGVMNQYQQFCRDESTYWNGLWTLQYDVLYGQKYLYDGESPYEPTDMKMGMAPITIRSVTHGMDAWYINGENFSPYCKVTVNGKELKTAYISPWILQVQENPGTMDVEDFNIRVIDTHKEILSDTE